MQHPLLPPLGENAAAAFFIKNARVSFSNFKISLVTVHHKITTILAPVLQTLVAPGRCETIREPNLEIGIDGISPVLLQDQEVITLGRVILRCNARDCPILDRPMVGSARPICQVLPVEEAFESWFFGLRAELRA